MNFRPEVLSALMNSANESAEVLLRSRFIETDEVGLAPVAAPRPLERPRMHGVMRDELSLETNMSSVCTEGYI